MKQSRASKPGLRWKKLLAIGLSSALITGSGIFVSRQIARGELVAEVVDGDTFILENRQPIRLYGIDAPDLTNCMGNDSHRALTDLINNTRVRIREPLSDGRGRIMALVYSEDMLINEIMVRSGLAQFRRQGGSATDRMREASDYARKNRLGIYSDTCTQTEPPDPTRQIKGNIDETTRKKTYYLPSCGFYSLVKMELFEGDRWFASEQEAKADGFLKSDTCMR